jgi:hypothetical protein
MSPLETRCNEIRLAADGAGISFVEGRGRVVVDLRMNFLEGPQNLQAVGLSNPHPGSTAVPYPHPGLW